MIMPNKIIERIVINVDILKEVIMRFISSLY